MREIKFRAWYDQIGNPHMIDNKDINFDEGKFAIWDDEEKLVYEGFEVMQYTGLKDKNGVEIYEGDICKETFKDTEGEQSSKKIFYWPVAFVAGAFVEDHLPGENPGEDFNCMMALRKEDYLDVEVAGNIYENPELLNK